LTNHSTPHYNKRFTRGNVFGDSKNTAKPEKTGKTGKNELFIYLTQVVGLCDD
jgi:hypothetical protein